MTTKTKTRAKASAPHGNPFGGYTPPVFLVSDVYLDFDIADDKTTVSSRLLVQRNKASKDKKGALVLNGEDQKLISVSVDGRKLARRDYTLKDDLLTIPGIKDKAEVAIVSTNDPTKNTALLGLYAAGPMLCTQCESEGFRRITFYPDRPDVLARFHVTIHADKEISLFVGEWQSRGKRGREKAGRHFAKWEDPFPKPCYLFALVANKLDRVTDSFRTKSGRDVQIEIYINWRSARNGLCRHRHQKIHGVGRRKPMGLNMILTCS